MGSPYQAHFRVWKLEAVTQRFLEASVNLPEASSVNVLPEETSVNLPEASVNLPEASVNLPEASVKLPMYTNTVFLHIGRFTGVSRTLAEDSGTLPEDSTNLPGISGRILPASKPKLLTPWAGAAPIGALGGRLKAPAVVAAAHNRRVLSCSVFQRRRDCFQREKI